MKKKTLITLAILLFTICLSISYSFAANELEGAAQGVKNVVNGTGNVIEDAAGGIASGVKNGMESTKNTVENMTKGAMTSDNNNNGNYTASRTATTANTESKFLGMNASTWSWLIIGIVAVAIIGLVWYYMSQRKYNSNHNDNY